VRRRLLLSALAGLAIAGCGEEANPGEVVRASDVRGPTQGVLIPTGMLYVTASEPAEQLPDGVAGPDDVAGGGRWIGVSWDLQPGPRRGAAELALERPPLKAPTLALVADGLRYPIGPAYRVVRDRVIASAGSQDRFVAVAGDPRDVAVAVTYDGVTQTIDPATTRLDAGDARGLYHIITTEPHCTGTATTRPGLRGVHFRCRVDQRVLVPYVGGLGWAAPGRAWAVVDVHTGLDADRAYPSWPRPEGGGDVRYVAAGARRTYTVDGRPPVATIRSEGGPADGRGEAERVLVFDVLADAPGTLRIDQRMRLIPQALDDGDLEAGAPAQIDLVVRRRAALG
jgi:hypothetical protein